MQSRQAPARRRAPGGSGIEAVRRVHAELAEALGGELPLRLWDGTELGEAAPYRLVLQHPWSLRRLVLPMSDLTAGEAYVEGDIDLEGDVIGLLHAASRLATQPMSPARKARIAAAVLRLPKPPHRPHARRARLHGRLHSLERDRQAIAFHYDLPHDFYSLFLGSTLTYSCAYFGAPQDDLDAAQERKLDLICRKLRLRPGQRLLDIGCGWGSLLLHAARAYGVEGVGVTLSRTQLEAGRRRIRQVGLEGRVELRLQDYREVRGRFDAVASVGMVEHVGPEQLPDFYRAAWERTAPGGLFLCHGIVTGRPDDVRSLTNASFSATYVFPDGGLVPLWRAVEHPQRAGFEVVDVEQLRPHYALTLRAWLARLEAQHERAAALTSEADYRIWRVYMAASAVAFDRGDLGVVQVLASKGADLPLGRAWMLQPEPAAAP